MRRALGFLTLLPGGGPPTATTLGWFPIAGVLIGGTVGAIWWGTSQVWPPLVAAAVAVVADLAITGMLHFDGLVDSADGLLPPLPRERRLEAMADPHVGAFGVTVAGAALLLRWTAFASIAPEPLVVAALWCASRSVAGAAAISLPYARPAGLASAFRPAGRTGPYLLTIAATGTVLATSAAAVGGGSFAVVAGAGCATSGLALIAWARHRLGGFTGDVLGAAIVCGETVGLLLLAVR